MWNEMLCYLVTGGPPSLMLVVHGSDLGVGAISI